MKKVLYLTAWNFKNRDVDGICKKVEAQVRVFKSAGYQVDFAYTNDGQVMVEHDDKIENLGNVSKMITIILCHNLFAKYFKDKKYDAVYIRHCVISPCYIHLLSVLKKNCEKIIVEIPTYPYDQTLMEEPKLRLGLMMDKYFRKDIKKYVDRIVTFSKDDEIWGVKTIKLINGVDFASIPQANSDYSPNTINLIAVAGLAPWHGYDRILRGMSEYYKSERDTVVNFHIVGDGKERLRYQEICKDGNIESYVTFYGYRSGKDLDNIYNNANVAVSVLGMHRIGLQNASSLKSREYGARGFLIISSCEIDFLPKGNDFVLTVPADESIIDINEVVKFYHATIEKYSSDDINAVIRGYAEKTVDMKVTLLPVMEYIG